MGSSKGNWGRYGLQASGDSVLGPPLFYLINPVIEHFKGNHDAVAYTRAYVNQWDSIRLALSENLFGRTLQRGGTSYVQVIKHDKKQSQRIYASNKRYYIPQYRKNSGLIWIKGVDEIIGLYSRHHDAAGVQNGLMCPNMMLSVCVNRKQWEGKSCGTEEKPMLVFLHRIIPGDDIEERNKNVLRQDSLFLGGIMVYFYPPPKAVQRMRNTPDSANYKLAEYYLCCPLLDNEFERLSEEE